MSQKLPIGNFEWIEKDDISKFDETFIKNYDENSDKGYIFEVNVKYPENIRICISICRSYLEERKLISALSLFVLQKIKKTT